MDTYFGNLNEGTHIIADDVKIHGQDEATHDKHLIQVLNQCRKVGLKLNTDKCVFKATSIPFFGHVISREGIKPDPKKIEAVKTMTTPTSKLELQSFLGLCNYLAIYIPSLSAVLQPLHELTKKDTDFQWNSQYDSLYQCAKDHIVENCQTFMLLWSRSPSFNWDRCKSVWFWCCIVTEWKTNFIYVKGFDWDTIQI